jgi:tetratricopeptide (TPR) repeat protein
MRARIVSIATAAGLALVVFAIGALGPGAPQAPGARHASTTIGASGDTFLVPASGGGSLVGAIASLESRLELAPDDWQASAALGVAYVQQARVTADPSAYPVAEATLRRSLELHPHGNADALVGLGTLAAARHDFAAALRWGRRAVRVAPFDADAYGLLGDAQVELGRYRAAFASFQRMVDTRPDLSSYARVSYALELRGNVAGAIDAMSAAADLAARPADVAWAAAQVGKLHFGVGRIDEAEEWLRRAQAADPRSMEAEAGLALVAWASGDVRAAIGGYERLVTRFPSPEHVATLGDLYAAAGDTAAAVSQFDLVLAEARLFRANGVNTDLEIALVLGDHPRAGSARAALRAARAEWARRKSVQVADALAWALYANGRYREAAAASEQALRLGTRNALFLFHAGMIRLRLGDEAAAERLLRDAAATNPSFSVRWSPVLRMTLSRLGDD